MKKLLITFAILGFGFANAQITLEHTYTESIVPVKLSRGDRLIAIERNKITPYIYRTSCSSSNTTSNTLEISAIKIYDNHHALEKTINVSNSWCPTFPNRTLVGINKILNVTDKVFNTDDNIEIGFTCRYIYSYISFGCTVLGSPTFDVEPSVVVSENGTELFRADSSIFTSINSQIGLKAGLEIINGGVKLFVLKSYGPLPSTKIYSLPGTLASLSEQEIEKSKLKLYPNPSYSTTNLAYSLPKTIQEGEIVVSDINGKILKSFKVDHAFSDIILDNSSLSQGIYFYSLWANGKLMTTQKQFVIK